MALIQADRVKETSSTTGTGNFSLSGASTGFRTFSDGVGVGNTCYYVITEGPTFEIGLGTLNASATLARTTVLVSSSANAAVNWGSGSKDVFTTYAASKAVILNSNNELDLASALTVAGALTTSAVSSTSTLFVSAGITGRSTLDIGGNASVGGTFNIRGNASGGGTLSIKSNASVGGTLKVTDESNLEDVSASGTLDVAGETSLGNVSASGTLNIGGVSTFTGAVSAKSTLTVDGDINNTAGNFVIDATSHIVEVKGGDSVDGTIQFNCRSNSHGQKVASQPHSAAVDNQMLLPKGADSTLVSEAGTATLSFKTLDSVVSVSAAGAVLTNSTVSDVDGNLRNVPQARVVNATADLVTTDLGNFVLNTLNNNKLNVPTGDFATGQIISVVNRASAATIVNAVGTTGFIIAGATAPTATATLGNNGVCSILFIGQNSAYLTGNVS